MYFLLLVLRENVCNWNIYLSRSCWLFASKSRLQQFFWVWFPGREWLQNFSPELEVPMLVWDDKSFAVSVQWLQKRRNPSQPFECRKLIGGLCTWSPWVTLVGCIFCDVSNGRNWAVELKMPYCSSSAKHCFGFSCSFLHRTCRTFPEILSLKAPISKPSLLTNATFLQLSLLDSEFFPTWKRFWRFLANMVSSTQMF